MTEAMQRHPLDPAAFARFPGRVLIAIGGRSHARCRARRPKVSPRRSRCRASRCSTTATTSMRHRSRNRHSWHDSSRGRGNPRSCSGRPMTSSVVGSPAACLDGPEGRRFAGRGRSVWHHPEADLVLSVLGALAAQGGVVRSPTVRVDAVLGQHDESIVSPRRRTSLDGRRIGATLERRLAVATTTDSHLTTGPWLGQDRGSAATRRADDHAT